MSRGTATVYALCAVFLAQILHLAPLAPRLPFFVLIGIVFGATWGVKGFREGIVGSAFGAYVGLMSGVLMGLLDIAGVEVFQMPDYITNALGVGIASFSLLLIGPLPLLKR